MARIKTKNWNWVFGLLPSIASISLYFWVITVIFAVVWALPALALLGPTRNLPPSAFAATAEPQKILLLQTGIAAFSKRLEIVQAARQSIDVEYYIYSLDQAGRLFTQALIQKARQGVRVRILVDQGPMNDNIGSYEAAELAKHGIQVRFYNDTSLLNFGKVNHRTHRKSLIVDGQQVIMGGRNMADEYFDFSDKYNFSDRDVWVEGSIVKNIAASFEAFWNSKLSSHPRPVRAPVPADYGLQSEDEEDIFEDQRHTVDRYKLAKKRHEKNLTRSRDFVSSRSDDGKVLLRIQKIASKLLALEPQGLCRETYFYADLPGVESPSSRGQTRVLREQIPALFETALSSIMVESPFFIQNSQQEAFSRALARGLKVEILTNSLSSTDTILTVAPFLLTNKKLSRMGAAVFVDEGEAPRWQDFSNPAASTAAWGVHAKSAVLDDETILIGSYNFDPRSENLNAEMALVCRGEKTLAEGLKYNMHLRKGSMARLNSDGVPADGRYKHLTASTQKKLAFWLLTPFAYLLQPLL